MRSPASIIRQLMIDLSLGTASGAWQIFTGFLPDQPGNAICVYDVAGKGDGRMMGSGEQIIHPGIQIRVRGKNYSDTWDKVYAIGSTLDGEKKTIVEFASDEAYRVDNVSRIGSPIPLGMEEQGSRKYFHFTINAITTLFETTDSAPFVGADWSPYWVRN